MSTLKQSIFWVAFYLIAVVILAQFDYQEAPIIDFAKYFYLTAIVVVPATVFFPSVSKVNVFIPMAIWGCIYLVILQMLDRSASAPHGSLAIVTLEFVLVEAGVWLGYQLAFGISHAESVMDAMALTAFPNRTQSLQDSSKQIKTEFTRSRRFHRPIGLLVLQIAPGEHIQIKEMIASIQHDLWNRFSFARIGQIIDEHIRQTDMVFHERGSRFVILCPETEYDNTLVLAKRIVDAIEHRTGLQVKFGAADFPNDAINFDDLLDIALARLVHPAAKDSNLMSTPESVEVH